MTNITSSPSTVWSRLTRILLVLAWLSASAACGRAEDSTSRQAYDQQLTACRTELLKDSRVPIVGGGHLNAARLGSNFYTIRYTEHRCGTDGFEATFYWTGNEIVPSEGQLAPTRGAGVPSDWRRLTVAAKLGDQRLAKRCRESPNDPSCQHQNPGLPPTWPEERILRLKNYPGLQLWLPERPPPRGVNELHFVVTSWPRKDGVTPRVISCHPWGRFDVPSMTRQELQNIDLTADGNQVPCDVEFWDFDFRGGAARVRMRSDVLTNAVPALKALQTYISASIDIED